MELDLWTVPVDVLGGGKTVQWDLKRPTQVNGATTKWTLVDLGKEFYGRENKYCGEKFWWF